MKKIYLLKGLDCPHCSAKIEKEVGSLTFVKSAVVNLVKQKLTVNIEPDFENETTEKIIEIVNIYEPEVEVISQEEVEITHSHDHSHEENEKAKLVRLIAGSVIFVIGIVLNMLEINFYVCLILLLSAYLMLGYDVLLTAVKNILKGRVFDENFLMSLSTVGAIILGEYPEAVAVMLFYQIGEYFQDLSVKRSRKSIADLLDIRPDSAVVVRGGENVVVSPKDILPGEEIIVKAGEKIALDGVVVSGNALLDTKAITGESLPKSVTVGDEVLSASINTDGVLHIKVTKEYGESTASKIIDLVENATANKAPSENFITTFARFYTPAVVVFAALFAIVPIILFGGEASVWIHRALVFLVISCPCALVISIPLTFFGGVGAASKHGVLVKGSNYLEALSRVDTIAFDKTGTLTKGNFKVTKIVSEKNFTKEQVLEYAAFAESFSNHPIAKSVTEAYGKAINQGLVTNYKEIAGKGITAEINGKQIFIGNSKLMLAENIAFTPTNEYGTCVYVAVEGVLGGYIIIADEVKADSKKAIEELKEVGINKTVLLTGDSENIAKSVANTLKISQFKAELLPSDKVETVKQFKADGARLAFVGDGINDAPVLAISDVGIAMGGIGSDAAIEAADVVLMTDEPSKIPDAIRVAKATKQIVIQNIIIALGVKGLFLILGAFGIAGMWEAVFADVGVTLIAVLNAMRIMKK